ncbi:alpha-ribazole phosphatase [Vibrio sp. S9_S30]|uniref:histidine phosphatase family protein n=1 Tax=Vibrio sp. S9_S30 TaxID=2720226 RepID=UPI001681752B|nr:histidine phosphatase family protein [Vibrio sp. S9_S30]MBD1556746.1 alpha-ribazole phosphatase [Vibrio sp. S9_S30]
MVANYNIYLVRHGKVTGEPALNGLTDAKVSEALQSQIAQDLVSEIGTFNSIISSPLSRCLNLAKLLSLGKDSTAENSSQPLASVEVSEAFKEMFFGDLDGKPFDSIPSHWHLLDDFWRDPASHPLPNAETLEEFHDRVESEWQALTQTCQQNTLIVTHGGVIRMILASVLGLDWRNPALYSTLSIANASVTHIELCKAEQVFIKVRSIGVTIRK